MGNTCGIDSIQLIDNKITSLLYIPPLTDKNLFKYLNTQYSKIFIIENNKTKIATLEINPPNLTSDKILIYVHGNSEDIYTSCLGMEHIAMSLGIKVVTFDYVGYGLSTDDNNRIPSEEGCYKAINIVMEYYMSQYSKNKMYLVGISLGSGVVVEFVHKNHWTNPIMLISPYKSIGRIVYDASYIDKMFKHNMFSTYDKIHKITCPVKIIHGKDDTLINVSHGYDIYNKLKNKSLKPEWQDGRGHSTVNMTIEHLTELINFN